MLRIVFGLNQIMLRRHRGLVLDHGKAEDEEEDVPGHHGASVQLFMEGRSV